jgi:hypothetical protein
LSKLRHFMRHFVSRWRTVHSLTTELFFCIIMNTRQDGGMCFYGTAMQTYCGRINLHSVVISSNY